MGEDGRRALTPHAAKAHLADTFRWTRDHGVDWTTMLGAALGMAGPIVLAAVLGQLEAGLSAAVGSLMASSSAGAPSTASRAADAQAAPRRPPSRRVRLAVTLGPALAAPVVSVLLAGHGWKSDAALTLVVGAAALVSGYSRATAMATLRFVLFLMIGVAVAETAPHRGGLVLLMVAGALWTAFVTRVLRRLTRNKRGTAAAEATGGVATKPEPTAAQKWRRFRRILATLDGWQFALRLTLSLAVADALKALWPGHHLHWIALTVALLTERQIQRVPVRTTQRALGTLIGVAATLVLAEYQPPDCALAAGIFVLAGLRPRLRAANYLAYAAVMTPLIIVLLDRGAPPGVDVLVDRLVATLVGAALVIGMNVIFRSVARP